MNRGIVRWLIWRLQVRFIQLVDCSTTVFVVTRARTTVISRG
jgi:hypothetical protein